MNTTQTEYMAPAEKTYWNAPGDVVDNGDLFTVDGDEVYVKLSDVADEDNYKATVYDPYHFHLRFNLDDDQIKNILTTESRRLIYKHIAGMVSV